MCHTLKCGHLLWWFRTHIFPEKNTILHCYDNQGYEYLIKKKKIDTKIITEYITLHFSFTSHVQQFNSHHAKRYISRSN